MIWEIVRENGLLELSTRELREDEGKRQILAGVMTALRQPISDLGCLKCFYEAQNTLKRLHKSEMAKQSKSKPNQQYLMKENTNYFLPEFGGYVNRENCTDELAEAILKDHPERLKIFEKYPKQS